MPQNSMARDEAGNIWEVDAQGNAVRLVQPASPQQMPADPTYPYQGDQARADVASTTASTANAQAGARRTNVEAGISEATAPTTVSTANLPSGYRWIDPANPDMGAEPIPGTAAARDAERSSVSGNAAAAAELLRLIDDPEGLQSIYDSEFMNNGPRSLGEYTWGGLNQSDALANLQAQNDAALPLIKRFMRVSGEGATSDRDQQAFLDLLPDPNARDSANQRRIENIRQAALSVLRQEGVDTSDYDPASEETRGSVWAQPRIVNQPAQMQAAGEDATTTSVPVNPELQQEYQSWVLANIGAGDYTPDSFADAYANMRQALDQQHGYESGTDYAAEGRRLYEGFQNGGTLNLNMAPIDREMSGTERFRNSMVNNPLGAGIAAVGDAGSFGAVSAMAPDQMGALREERPGAMLAGDIAGSIGGTAMLGGLARNTIGKALPSAMANSGRAQFGRNLATDAAYSGIYGANTGQNPLESIAWGAGGSAVGQGMGRVIGATARGVQPTRAVEYLRSRNIPLTGGQTLGGFAKSAEDRMQSMPFIGDMIGARRREGLEAFDLEALGMAGEPINFTPTRIGREGVGDLMGDPAAGTRGAVSDAYDSAVAGQNFTLDPQLTGDVNTATQGLGRLPQPLRDEADQALRNTFEPLQNNGSISGEQWQGLRSNLSGYRAGQTGPGFPQDYRQIMTGGIDALDSLAGRQGGPGVVDGLQNANTAYRLGNIVQDAAYRADGAEYVFTPSQLQDAVKKSQRRYTGRNDLLDLADAGQDVLPSRIPDSGTAGRLAQMSLPAAVGGTGAAAGYAMGGDAESAGTGAGISTLAGLALLAGGTRQGQRAFNDLVTRRPDVVRRLGNWATRNSGLFGTAAMAPVVVGQQN